MSEKLADRLPSDYAVFSNATFLHANEMFFSSMILISHEPKFSQAH